MLCRSCWKFFHFCLKPSQDTVGCLVVQLVDGRPTKAIFHCRGKIKTINTKMHGSSSCCCPRSRSPIAKAIFGGSTLWPLSLLCGPNWKSNMRSRQISVVTLLKYIPHMADVTSIQLLPNRSYSSESKCFPEVLGYDVCTVWMHLLVSFHNI